MSATTCIEWVGATDGFGYGIASIWVGGRAWNVRVHRFAYQQWHGPIPAGLVVMHSCDNPRCVNTDHLKVGTQQDNVLDMVAKGRARPAGRRVTECPAGHLYDESNTYHREGKRHCRTCSRVKAAQARQKRRDINTGGTTA